MSSRFDSVAGLNTIRIDYAVISNLVTDALARIASLRAECHNV